MLECGVITRKGEKCLQGLVAAMVQWRSAGCIVADVKCVRPYLRYLREFPWPILLSLY